MGLRISPLSGDKARSEALRKKGVALFQNGSIDVAIEVLNSAIAICPTCAKSFNNLGIAYWYRGDLQTADEYIQNAYRLSPEDPQIVLNLAQLLQQCGKVKDSRSVLQSFLSIHNDPTIAKALFKIESTVAKETTETTHKKKLAVFISDAPRSREAKIAYGLKTAGWDVVLLCRDTPVFDASRYFIAVHRYTNANDALRLAREYRPIIYHVFSNWNFLTASVMIKNKPGKIVFDDYDVMAGHVRKEFSDEHYPGQSGLERFCLENADGLCCRSPEIQFAKHFLGYKYIGKKILFMDYCWDFSSKPTSMSDEIHIVYCGNMGIEKFDDDPNAYQLWLAKSLACQGIHYHIYPAHWPGIFEDAFSDYIELMAATPYFHLHKPCAPDDLIMEMAKYSLGILILSRHINGSDSGCYELSKFEYAISNKIFDYFDAGLPVIMSHGRFPHFVASRYGASVDASVELLTSGKDILLRACTSEMKTKAIKSRKAYSIHHHIGRLVDFYQAL